MFTFVSRLLNQTGLVGVFGFMLLENLAPIIPSELILPMVGYEAALGRLNLYAAILVATFGSASGGAAWYELGRRFGQERTTRFVERYGRWLTLTPVEVSRAVRWFDRWGSAAVCVGRCLPGVRGVICIPAGVTGMPPARFLLWSTIGALGWSSILVLAGVVLGSHYDQAARWVNPVSDGFLTMVVGLYLWRFFRFRSDVGPR